MILAESLHKAFNTKTGRIQAVSDVSFRAEDGKITGLLGPNGAGKTTTMRMLYTPDEPLTRGRVSVDGIDATVDPTGVRRRLGVLPDARGVYKRLTARENIAYFGQLHGLDASTIAKRTAALSQALDMDDILDRQTDGFSQGQRTKTAIARALVHDPRNVILDEPTNGLDVMTTRGMRRFLHGLRDEGRCVIFSSHIMQEVAALCDHIVIIAQGTVMAAGSADALLREQAGESNLEDAFVKLIGSEEGLTHEHHPHLLIVMRKELRDLSRDRRTLALTLLMGPLLYPILILGMGKLAESRVKTQIEQPLEVPMIGTENAPNLVKFLAAQGLNATQAPADLTRAIRDQRIDVALRISDEFDEHWRDGRPALVEIIKDSTRRAADVPSRRLERALEAYSGQVGALRLMARGIDAQVARPLDVATQDMATAEAKQGVMLSLLLPVLLSITSFLGGAYLVMDTTAGERERQSLEPLLATPASRGAIVSGKIAAACVIGLASLLLTLAAFKLSAQLSDSSVGRQLNMGVLSMAQMLLVMLPMLLIGTSLLTFLAAASKSMKEAQSHMTWLMLLPMLPGYALIAYPLKSELWQFAVPFLAQNQMLLKVIRHEVIGPATWAMYLGASLGLAALLWYAAVYRYRQERLAIAG